MDDMRLSVLDLINVRTGQTTSESLRASKAMVEAADELGYTRYWVAEHHNTESVASTAPAVELMYLGADTSRIRLGSGGVMLPNHSPLAVAEQFALLANVFGDRIDLGIGRAPGTDPITSAAIRGHLGGGHFVDDNGRPMDPVQEFPSNIHDILALLSPDGASVRLRHGQTYHLRPAPDLPVAPQVWLLGSSDYSAQLAASLGLPYVFANHFSGQGLERALDLYRSGFQPSEAHPSPVTFLTVNAVAAPTQEEADARALPQLRMMARLRRGRPLRALETVEEAAAGLRADADVEEGQLIDAVRGNWFVGTGDAVASELSAFAARWDVDEVMLAPVAGAHAEEPLDAAPGALQTLDLLAP